MWPCRWGWAHRIVRQRRAGPWHWEWHVFRHASRRCGLLARQSKAAGQYANVVVGSVKWSVGGALLLEMQWADVPWRAWAPANFSGVLTLSIDEIAGTIEKVQDTSRLFGRRLS